MRAGALNHRITIERATESANSYGERTKTWSEFATMWASIEPLTGREFYQSKQIGTETTHNVTIRYKAGITQKMRVKYGSRYFDIESVINEKERGVKMFLMCKEVT